MQRPLASWRCNEGSGSVVHNDTGANNGNWVGNARWQPSESGHALEFTDSISDYVQVGNANRNPIIPAGSDFTISVWINPTDYSKRQGVYGHFSSLTFDAAAYWLEIHNGGLAVGLGDGTKHQFFQGLNGSHALSPGQWVHWTVVLDGDTLRSYINGELANTQSVTALGNICPQAGPAGTKREVIGAHFCGRIDDICIWDSAVSERTIRRVHFDAYAHWEFEEPRGRSILDSNGDNHGTMLGRTKRQSGQPGKGVEFGGSTSDYIQIGSVNREPMIPAGSDFTISTWLNSEDYSKRQGIFGHYSNLTSSSPAYWLEIYNGRLAVGLGDGSKFQFFENLNGSHTLTAGQWVHWTVVLKGNTLRSFINGQLAHTQKVTALNDGYPKAGPDGTKREILGATFDGRIDDFRVWNKALDASLVTNVFYDSMIDVRAAPWFAQGDGTNDDTKAINEALLASNGDNKFVLLDGGIDGPPATFLTKNGIKLPPNTKLYARNAVLKNGSRNELNDGSPPLLEVKSGCEVHDLIIDGNFNGVEGIKIRNSTDVLIKKCTVQNIERNRGGRVFGVHIQQLDGESNNIRLQSCQFNHIVNSSTTSGTSANCRAIMISSNTTTEYMSDIVIDDCKFSHIRANNQHKDGDCIQIYDTHPNIPEGDKPWNYFVTNCEFSDYSKRGVKCQSDRCYVSNNYFHDPDHSTWPPAIAFSGNNSKAEGNNIDYRSNEFGYGFTISGNNSHLFNNKITLHPAPRDDYANGAPNRSCGFYIGSKSQSTNNLIDKNLVIGGRWGLSVLSPKADGNEFIHNTVGAIGGLFYNPNGTTNITAPNTLLH